MRVNLTTDTTTAVVSTLRNAVGLLATADMTVAYVGQQTGANSICRVPLATGHVKVLPVTLTGPFFMTWAGPGESGILLTVGATSVTWVHDERLLVGDNMLDWVSPVLGARSRQCLETVQHGCWRARRWQELAAQTLRCEWAILAVVADRRSSAQAGMA